jgi:tRNA dimethylallyltransferase
MSQSVRSLIIPLLIGPTAVGKTTVSLEVAQCLNGEIVSADSRQVYQLLDIGTAKPSAAQLAAIPHHFVGELKPDESFSAGQFARAAESRIGEIQARGRMPLVVGGSTLYTDALVRGFSEIPDVDPDVRNELNLRLLDEGPGRLYIELQAVDPVSAATMDESKSQRIVRALEIYHGTGTPLSEFHASRQPSAFSYSGVILTRPRADLYARIDARVDEMLLQGLVAEVEGILASGISSTANALRTIGYREVIAHLNGEIDYPEMVRLIKRNSRRYAKRQITWFNRYESFQRIDTRETVDTILESLGLQ